MNIPIISKNDLVKMNRRDYKAYCSHPDASPVTCKYGIKKAHTVSRYPFLTSIIDEESQSVIEIDFQIQPKESSTIIQKDKSIDTVSVFKGFCGKHDTELFRTIEHEPFEANEFNAFVLSYRAMAHAVYRFEEQKKHFTSQTTKMSSLLNYIKDKECTLEDIDHILGEGNALICPEIKSEIRTIIENIKKHPYKHKKNLDLAIEKYAHYVEKIYYRYKEKLKNVDSYISYTNLAFNEYKSIFLSGNYSRFKYLYVEYDTIIPYACSSSFGINEKNGEKNIVHIHMLPIKGEKINSSYGDRTFILFSWLSDNKNFPLNHIEKLILEDKEQVADASISAALCRHGNIFFSKKTWNNWSPSLKEDIAHELLKNHPKQEIYALPTHYNFMGPIEVKRIIKNI